jgi:hypothetical protein
MSSQVSEQVAARPVMSRPLRERGPIGWLLSSIRDGAGFDVVLVTAGLLFLLAFAGFPFAYNFVMSFQQVASPKTTNSTSISPASRLRPRESAKAVPTTRLPAGTIVFGSHGGTPRAWMFLTVPAAS